MEAMIPAFTRLSYPFSNRFLSLLPPLYLAQIGLLGVLSEQRDGPDLMERESFSGLGNGSTQVDSEVLQSFQRSFVQVQGILDQNRLLINEINQNHESRAPDNLNRNVGLIRELNNNIRRVVDLYADLSITFARSVDGSSEGDSASTLRSEKACNKRIRHG